MTSVVESADRYSVWVVGKDVVIMNEKDKLWIEKCKADKDGRYIIMVDNDSIYVWDVARDEEAYTFCEYGYHFALGLLRYIGCEADYV